jgi:hypothetical protein
MKSRITDDPFRLALGQYRRYIPFARSRYVGEDHTSNGQIAARQEKWVSQSYTPFRITIPT